MPEFRFQKYIKYIKNERLSLLETAVLCINKLQVVKYSPPIEAGASFNLPNLAKDFILQASVSETMVFL